VRLAACGIEYAHFRASDGWTLAGRRPEWDLLKLFTSHPDKVLTDRMITDAVWGGASYRTQAHSLHVCVGRPRKKLRTGEGMRRQLVTEPRRRLPLRHGCHTHGIELSNRTATLRTF
jgi:hypothetical protein